MSVKLITSFGLNILTFGYNAIFQLLSIVINCYLITLQRVLLSLLIIFGEIPISRHEPMSERRGLFVYRIIRNYVNLIQYLRNWLGRWYDSDILKAAPIPILYEDDEIDESFFSNDRGSVTSVFEDSENDCDVESSKNIIEIKKKSCILKIFSIPMHIILLIFKTIFSYVEFPEESVTRVSISSFSHREVLPIEYSSVCSKNAMETSDYQSDVEFIDDECF